MKNSVKIFLFLSLVIFSISDSYSQKGHFSDPDYNRDDYDILDGLREKKKEKMLAKGDTIKKETKQKKVYWIALPVVGYNPFTGLIIGVGGIFSSRLGDPSTTRMSSIVPSYTWTTNNQNVVRINSSIYTKDEKFYFFNSIQWAVSPQITYGIGGDSQKQWETEIAPSTMKFVLRGYKKVAKNLFVGINVNFDRKYELEDETALSMQDLIVDGQDQNLNGTQVQNNIEAEFGEDRYDSYWEKYDVSHDGFVTDYNNGSEARDLQQDYYPTPFGNYPYGTQKEYSYNGIGVNLLYDSRDNINTPFKGSYANLIVNTYPEWFGSTFNSSSVYADIRHYFKIKDNYTQILGVWGLANLTFGDTPYLNLPRIGGDDWYSSGRGYTAGRYVGEQLLYLEAEYRVNLYKWFGMTAFANAHTVSEPEGGFKYINPGVGMGFRFQVIKSSRSTICFDYGVGKDGSSGAYMRFISAF